MKNLILIGILTASHWIFGQSSQPFQPWSITKQVSEIREFRVLPDVDVAALLEEDERAGKNVPYRFGFEHDLNEDFFTHANRVSTGNGVIYRQLFESDDALALRFVFDSFHLPEGVNLFAYNPNLSQIEGAYTQDNIHSSGYFSTPLVTGDQIILELNAPHEISTEDIQLHIEMIIHDYKGIILNMGRDRGCGINVMCDEAESYIDQINAVSWIDMGSGLCTGAMINNTEQDLTPYYYTAAHCTVFSNPGTFRFYFNYYVDGCEDGNSIQGPYAYSSIVRADCGCVSGTNINNMVLEGPDFTLLEITDNINETWEVFYAGWNREDPDQMPISVGVHHPIGEPKKINFDDGFAISSFWQGPQDTHWFFTWDEGGTLGGSSGSPLYDDQGRIAGTLTGGAGDCSGAGTTTDYYGKFSAAWNWGITPSMRLSDWLNPNNTQVTTLDGTYLPVSNELPGDATLDGLVNVSDIILIVQFIQGTLEPVFPQNAVADLNSDGNINIQDIIMIVNIILNN